MSLDEMDQKRAEHKVKYVRGDPECSVLSVITSYDDNGHMDIHIVQRLPESGSGRKGEADQALHDTLTNVDPRERERVKEMINRDGSRSTNVTIKCPLFAVEQDMGLPSTCSDLQAGSMSQVRIHLLRRHKLTVRHCATCTQDILNAEVFEPNHGVQCRNPEPYRKGLQVRQQWKELYTSLRQDMHRKGLLILEESRNNQIDLYKPT
jgi:hypothetical protein